MLGGMIGDNLKELLEKKEKRRKDMTRTYFAKRGFVWRNG